MNWAQKSSRANTAKGTKDKQRSDNEDRCADYRKWRWTFGDGNYVSDIDHIEWRVIEGEMVPVAIFELSRVDSDSDVPQTYLEAIIDRYTKRDAQSKFIKQVAASLEVYAYIVVFRADLEKFWVYNLSLSCGWYAMNKTAYEKWIRGFKDKKVEKLSKKDEQDNIPSLV